MQKILKKRGRHVNTVSSGEDAIKKAKERAHNRVFIDMMLPGINGLQPYLILKEINPELKAIMITAYRQKMAFLIEKALENSAYSFMYKPLHLVHFQTLGNEIQIA